MERERGILQGANINVPSAYNQALNPRYPGDVIFGVPESEQWRLIRGNEVRYPGGGDLPYLGPYYPRPNGDDPNLPYPGNDPDGNPDDNPDGNNNPDDNPNNNNGWRYDPFSDMIG